MLVLTLRQHELASGAVAVRDKGHGSENSFLNPSDVEPRLRAAGIKVSYGRELTDQRTTGQEEPSRLED